VHVRPDRPLNGRDAAGDAALLVRAIRAGHLYTAVDAVASPPYFEFPATNEHGTVHEGDELGAGGPITLSVRTNAPASFTTAVWRGTAPLAGDHHEQEFTVGTTGEPAVYWVEVRATGLPNPLTWIRSNAIYVRGGDAAGRSEPHPASTVREPIFDGKTVAGWRAEHDPASVAAVDAAPIIGGVDLRFRYGLAAGPAGGQVAALVYDTPRGIAPHDRIAVSLRAEHPMRISLQLRTGDNDARRWQRSVYADTLFQDRTVYVDDMLPVGDTRPRNPDPAAIRSVLFVVDANNTKPGSSGRIWIRRAALEH
jgi:hypothetical protein